MFTLMVCLLFVVDYFIVLDLLLTGVKNIPTAIPAVSLVLVGCLLVARQSVPAPCDSATLMAHICLFMLRIHMEF